MPATTITSVVNSDFAPRSAKRGHRVPVEQRVRYVPIEVRFERMTIRPSDPSQCWEWRGSKNKKGYGNFSVGGKTNHKIVKAHRVAYELVNGPVPPGLHILHTCDNAGCVNPAHLRADSNEQNQREAWARDRKKRVRKLDANAVLEIRASDESQAVLSKRFGVCQAEISRVRNGRRGDAILLMVEGA